MPLDTRGKIAAAEIAFYAPIVVLTALLVVRYAFRRDAGWFFLLIFSLSRMTEGALLVAGELNHQVALFSAAYIMQYSCLFALLFSTLGFIGMAGQHTYSENPRVAGILRLIGLLGLIGLGLCIAGGVLGTHKDADQLMAASLRRAGVCLYAAFFLILIPVHIGVWTYRWHLRSYRRSLLFGICLALPFLGARIAYAVISAFSSLDLYGTNLNSDPNLRKLNPINGQWYLYLVLGPVMEYVAILVYIFSSVVLAQRYHY